MVKRLLCIGMVVFICCYALQAQKGVANSKQKYTDSLINWLNTHPVDSVWVLNAHRVSYRLSETDIKRSFYYYEKVSVSSDSLNFLYGKALAQINLALLLFNSANFDASNGAYFKAIEYAEISGNNRLIAISYNNIAENFFTLKDYVKCREYALRAIDINRMLQAQTGSVEQQDSAQQKIAQKNRESALRGVAINHELLFRCLMEEKNYKEAISNLNTGMPLAESTNDSYVIAPYYLGYGRLHTIYNRPDSAMHYFEKALQNAQQGGERRHEFSVYLSRSTLLPQLPLQQRLADLNAALGIAQETDYLEGVSNAAEALMNVYDGENNKDSALHYFRMYRNAAQLLFSENNKRNVIIRESDWMLQKKDSENSVLKNKTSLQEKEIVTKNSLLLGTVVIFILAAVSGILAFTSIRSKKRRVELEKQRQESELKSRITDMEFKAFKAQLNPHFIFNYLNSVSGYILLSQPDKASDMIKRFSKMLRNVLQNSEQNEIVLGEDIKIIEQYLQLMQEIAAPPFTYSVMADAALWQLQKTVPPLFIQPYVENAVVHGLKHAEGDHLFLEICYRQNGLALEISITDNGVGFNPKLIKSQQWQDGQVHLGMSVTQKRVQVFAHKNNYEASIRIAPLYPGNAQPGTQVLVVINNFFS